MFVDDTKLGKEPTPGKDLSLELLSHILNIRAVHGSNDTKGKRARHSNDASTKVKVYNDARQHELCVQVCVKYYIHFVWMEWAFY